MARRANGEGSIYKDAAGRWCVAPVLADGKRKVARCDSRQEASDRLRQFVAEREQGRLVAGPRQTVDQFAKGWLDEVVKPNLRPRSYRSYTGRINTHLPPTLGGLAITRLTGAHRQRLYANKAKAGTSQRTLNNLHFVIHRMLEHALRSRVVGRNVAEDIDPPRFERRELTPFTQAEIVELRTQMTGHRHENLWTLLLAAGLRFGEAAALQWQDVDFDARLLTVRHTLAHLTGQGWVLAPPKTKSGRRTVPLAAVALEAVRLQQDVVRDWRDAAGEKWQENELVFPSERGTPLRESHVLKRFHDLLDTAELPQRRMHDLRHSVATTLFALGTHPRATRSSFTLWTPEGSEG